MDTGMIVSSDDSKVSGAVTGKLDFQFRDELRAGFTASAASGVGCVNGLSDTDLPDIPALAMLPHEHAVGDASFIGIGQASAEGREMLDVANFGKLLEL